MTYIHVSNKDRSKVKSQSDNLRMAGEWEGFRWRNLTRVVYIRARFGYIANWAGYTTKLGVLRHIKY